MLIDPKNSCLLVVDVQEKLVHAVHESVQLINNCLWLMNVANRLQIPTLISEQYPRGLGKTIPELLSLVPAEQVMEKVHFSCATSPSCATLLEKVAVRQFVLIGIESHVCVLQTAIGLLKAGYQVFVVADAVSSRSAQDKEFALARMRALGVQIVSREMVFFEWVQQAGTPEFKQLSKDFLQ
jgi:nicotinamidase-related amidase